MSRLTVIDENGIKRYPMNGNEVKDAVVRLINGRAYTTEELINLVAPKVVE